MIQCNFSIFWYRFNFLPLPLLVLKLLSNTSWNLVYMSFIVCIFKNSVSAISWLISSLFSSSLLIPFWLFQFKLYPFYWVFNIITYFKFQKFIFKLSNGIFPPNIVLLLFYDFFPYFKRSFINYLRFIFQEILNILFSGFFQTFLILFCLEGFHISVAVFVDCY